MNGSSLLKTTINLLLSMLFTGLALYIFLSAEAAGKAGSDLRLYAALTGAYGLWRLVRTIIAGRKSYEKA
ncbi:MAG: hypothetical protein K4305_02375 [Chlorobium sp.]|uniref:hypothetical protein n=1 Tax=Chlorobium sp. TaxID=1095 RepID=UPI002F3FE7D8